MVAADRRACRGVESGCASPVRRLLRGGGCIIPSACRGVSCCWLSAVGAPRVLLVLDTGVMGGEGSAMTNFAFPFLEDAVCSVSTGVAGSMGCWPFDLASALMSQNVGPAGLSSCFFVLLACGGALGAAGVCIIRPCTRWVCARRVVRREGPADALWSTRSYCAWNCIIQREGT